MNRVAALLALWLFSMAPALADPGVGNGGAGRTPATYATMSAAGTTTLKFSSGVFLGVANLATSAQIVSVTCYDNNSAASGPVLFNAVIGLMPPQFPEGGVTFVNGLTCTVATALTANGVAIYFR